MERGLLENIFMLLIWVKGFQMLVLEAIPMAV